MLDVEHERVAARLHVDEVEVLLQLETRGATTRRVMGRLRERGYTLTLFQGGLDTQPSPGRRTRTEQRLARPGPQGRLALGYSHASEQWSQVLVREPLGEADVNSAVVSLP